MEDKVNLTESLYESAEEYSRTTFELFKLKTLDKTSDVASSLIPYLAVLFFVFVSLFMVNIGIALWLGKVLGNTWYGFFTVAAFYAVIGIILLLLHKWLKKFIANFIVKHVLK